jgi:hypothetical protein
MSINHDLSTKQKALSINLNDSIYGTLAEIGAGQEVARYFFQAGGAAGTVAKTMSAYDMAISDTIYGKEKSGRYVVESRLIKMLDREYSLLIKRLATERSDDTKFFAFADTIAAKSFSGLGDCHGWLGVKFQHAAKAKPSQVIIHIKMFDSTNNQQQQAAGIVGVNLLHGCFNLVEDHSSFVKSLMDNLTNDRVEIDMIKVEGPAFEGIDSRVLSLEIVKNGYTKAIMFSPKGEVLQPSEILYRKNLLVLRGSYRPPTHVNVDMLKTGVETYKSVLPDEEKDNVLVLPEISLNKLREREGGVDSTDFLARIDLLTAIGQNVLISNYQHYHELNLYLSRSTKKQVAFVLGIYNLEEILNYDQYKNVNYGMLGALGGLIGQKTQLFLYPASNIETGELMVSSNLRIDKKVIPLVDYLVQNKLLTDIKNYNKEIFNIWSRKVLKMIQDGEAGWDKMVPNKVAKVVKDRRLFSK